MRSSSRLSTRGASGTATFTDVDLSDVHVVTSSAVSSDYGTPMGTFSAQKTADTTGTGTGGVVTWSYAIDNAAAQRKLDAGGLAGRRTARRALSPRGCRS